MDDQSLAGLVEKIRNKGAYGNEITDDDILDEIEAHGITNSDMDLSGVIYRLDILAEDLGSGSELDSPQQRTTTKRTATAPPSASSNNSDSSDDTNLEMDEGDLDVVGQGGGATTSQSTNVPKVTTTKKLKTTQTNQSNTNYPASSYESPKKKDNPGGMKKLSAGMDKMNVSSPDVSKPSNEDMKIKGGGKYLL